MKKPTLTILAIVLLMVWAGSCTSASTSAPTSAASIALPTLSLGTLPDDVAQVLDAAIQNEYCDPNSFTAKSLRMMSQMKGGGSGYFEMESTDQHLPFPAMEGGDPTLNPISPSHLKVRGLADGTDISILNYEEFIIQVEADTDFGGVIIPKGDRFVRENGSWVLEGPP